MPTVKDTIQQMELYFRYIQTAQAQLTELRPESFIDTEMYEDQRQTLQQQIQGYRSRLMTVLDRYDRFPSRHQRHFDKLTAFHQEGAYDSSVFIMTKFPDGATPEAIQLQTIIDLLKDGIRARGFVPRIAQGPTYHRWLWDNVELFLLGCGRGVAIDEDRYLPELNPNVALEWGWMAGMGREVLFLREEAFEHDRADWNGLLNGSFKWDDPAPGIAHALNAFLRQH